ncbi:ubiquitin thioesterase OTU1-like [Liolophura sinensis]|uniref:ubiquitin thioesterase OTU1-like n=1 Tax=Liolophura sinensis TaxID=3198878 RepID=UPI00315936BA
MASKPLNIRCQSKNGRHPLNGLTSASTVGLLRKKLSELTQIPNTSLKVLSGYPPKAVDLSDEGRELLGLISSGDTLIVEEDKSESPCKTSKAAVKNADNMYQKQMNAPQQGILTRKVVPANNSCLFTSINTVTTDGNVDLTASSQMRELIAGIVMSDPVSFSDAFLGRSNKDYCKWIMKDDSWGGAIEVAILSDYYSVEIDVVDTQSARIDRFGEDKNYNKRVLILYDGIHYDPLVYEPCDPNRPIQTIFDITDDKILAQAMEIASEAKASRQFTDVSSFTLRCLVCQKALKGQEEAQQHAKETSHINFGEV